ncbi:hypothetical protein CEK28_05925 [Xenophilus sp. AP218F]|nr:hypothetical protein CEK28_05925 [Xenophilus sp. AP218F]
MLFWLMAAFLVIVTQAPVWIIVRRAGYPGAVSLLYLIPIVNLIAIWVFAMAPWPAMKK